MRVAVVGMGNAGKRHAAAYAAEGFEVIPSDIGDDWRAAMDSADLVSIATPDDLHCSMVCYAMEHDKPVFCEKPLAHNDFSLRRIERAWHESGSTFSCNLPLRHNRRIIEFLDAFQGKFIMGHYGWGRKSKFAGWRGRIADYSIVCGGGIHIIDLMMLRYNVTKLGNPKASRGENSVVAAFGLGEVVMGAIIVDFSYEGEHLVRLQAGGKQVTVDEPQDFVEPIREFIRAAGRGDSGNGMEAIFANRACLEIEGAAR